MHIATEEPLSAHEITDFVTIDSINIADNVQLLLVGLFLIVLQFLLTSLMINANNSYISMKCKIIYISSIVIQFIFVIFYIFIKEYGIYSLNDKIQLSLFAINSYLFFIKMGIKKEGNIWKSMIYDGILSILYVLFIICLFVDPYESLTTYYSLTGVIFLLEIFVIAMSSSAAMSYQLTDQQRMIEDHDRGFAGRFTLRDEE